MSRLGNIFYLSVLFGALWGAIWAIIITLLALFISGLTFQPQVTAGALGGLIAAAVLVFQPPQGRSRGLRALAGFAFVLVLVLASGLSRLACHWTPIPSGNWCSRH